jgi:hypothetical protein
MLRELSPHPRTLVKTVVAPHVQDLIERSDLSRPIAFELAVIILANVARHRARGLDHVAERAGFYGVGSQFVDHDVSPRFIVSVGATHIKRDCARGEKPLTSPPKTELMLVSTPQKRGEGEESRNHSAACALISPDT